MLQNAAFLSTIFVISIFCKTDASKFSPAEKQIIVDLSKNFAVNHCVLINDEPEKIFDFIKYLSKSFMQSGHMTINQANSSFYRLWGRKVNRPHILAVLDVANFNDSLSVIFHYRNEYFVSKYIWVTFDADEEFFSEIYIPYNCEFLNIKKLGENQFEIFEVYNIKILSGYATTLLYGLWSESGHLEVTGTDFYNRRFDFNGTEMIALTELSPYRCLIPILCAYQEMVFDMSRIMNFRVIFINYTEYEDLRQQNETFITELNVVMFVMHSFGYNRDMIAPIWKTPAFLHIAYSKQYEQGSTNAHIKPLKPRVWVAIILWIVISGVCILFIKYFMLKLILKQKFIWTNHLFLSLDSFTNQCGSKIPNITAFRISVIMTRLVPLMVLSVYSATLLSFVKIRSIHLPFEDIEGLVRDGTFKIGFDNGTFLSNFFEATNDLILKTVREKHLAPLDEMSRGVYDGTNKICRIPKYALLFFNNDVFRKPRKCKILQIPKQVLTAWDAFDTRYNSPYKSILNKILKTIRSAGILKKMEKVVYGTKPPLTVEGQDSVDLHSISLIYSINLSVYLFAVILLAIECIYMRLIKKKKMKMRIFKKSM